MFDTLCDEDVGRFLSVKMHLFIQNFNANLPGIEILVGSKDPTSLQKNKVDAVFPQKVRATVANDFFGCAFA